MDKMIRGEVGRRTSQLISALLFGAVTLLVWRRNHFENFGVQIPTVKPSDIILIGLFLVTISLLLFSKTVRKNSARNAFLYPWIALSLLLMLSFVIGFLWSVYSLGYAINGLVIGQFIRLSMSFVFFLLVLFWGYGNQKLVRYIAYSFLSACVLIPVIFVGEETVLRHFLVVSPASYTLIGLQNSTIFMGSFLILPILLLFSLFVTTDHPSKRHAFLVLAALLLSLMIWTASRAAWLSVAVGILMICLMAFYKHRHLKKFLLHLCGVVAAFGVAFLLLPPLARNSALVRIFPHIRVTTHVDPEILRRLSLQDSSFLGDSIYQFLRLPTRFFLAANTRAIDLNFKDDRGIIWTEYTNQAIRNPLGLGPSYTDALISKSPEFAFTKSYYREANAHSLWLQLLLTGGVLALVAFLVFIKRVSHAAKLLFVTSHDWLALWIPAALLATLINISFIDSLEVRWIWVLFGLVVVASENLKLKSS